ncbi:MAG TPA: hypothetical protein VMZ53_23850 [Kofleriaceae bacterium]|nr:hypothetical protein [Kofleriaceae bacterium]
MRAWAIVTWAIVMLVGGCISSSSVVCDDGRVCPSGTVCREALCVPKTCGDGKVDPGEQCDGLDLGSLDCVDFGYYGPEGLTCSSTCFPETSTCSGGICGDGEVDPQEACDLAMPADHCGDFGFDVGRITCATTCTNDVSGCDRIGWTQMPSGTSADLTAVWGAGANDMFAVGTGGTILHYDGAGWSPMVSGTTADLMGISGSSSSFALAVGANGTILQWNGVAWTPMTTGTTERLNAVMVVSPARAFAVGTNDTVLFFDGGSWTKLVNAAAPGDEELLAVWANATDVLVAGFTSNHLGAMVRHYKPDQSWTIAFSEAAGGPIRALSGKAANDVWMAGRNDGSVIIYQNVDQLSCSTVTCTPVYTTGNLFGIWEHTPSNVYAVGSDGAIFHKTTGFSSWPARADTSHAVEDLRAVFGTDANNVFAVGANGRIVRSTAIQIESYLPKPGANYAGGFGLTEDELYTVGAVGTQGVIYEYVGANNNNVWVQDYLGGEPLNAVWSTAGGPTVVVGQRGVIRTSVAAPAWSAVHSDNTMTLNGIWGTSYNDLFTVGAGTNGGVILHFNGSTWSAQTVPPGVGGLFSVWGTSTANVFAVGDAGVILHYDGSAWSIVRAAASSAPPLYAVWTGGDEVIAVGGDIVQRHGTAWIATRAPTTLHALAGSPGNVYASGDLGMLLRWDGATWIRIESGTSRQLASLSVSGHSVAFTGAFGVIQRLDLGSTATQELVCGDYWDNDLDGLQNCADPDCAATAVCSTGGLCRGATNVTCGSTPGTTRGGPARFDLFSCADSFTTGSERFFRFTPAESGPVTAHLAAPSPELSIAVLRASPEGACKIDDCIGVGPDVTFEGTAGETYFFVVDGPDGTAGEFTLDVACP